MNLEQEKPNGFLGIGEECRSIQYVLGGDCSRRSGPSRSADDDECHYVEKNS